MRNQYRLVEVRNADLLAGLSKLVRQGNELTAQILAHLVELEQRMLHLELGFSSLFSYCVEALGMSEGSAGRRVAAARVCRQYPEVFERIARGDLHLCALCALAPHLSPANASELFDACRGKTRRQIEELLAARFPRPDVREQIRRLPARTRVASADLPQSFPLSPASEEPASRAAAEEAPTNAPNPVPPRVEAVADASPRPRGRELEPLSADRFGVHFTADAELRHLIERARALASHRIPNGDLAGLMKLMVGSFVRQEEKRRFGIGTRKRQAKVEMKRESSLETVAPPGEVSAPARVNEPRARAARFALRGSRGRYLAAQLRLDTHTRDGGQCAFIAPDGRRCSARTFLQFDHVKPFARFGAADASNIRLLCKSHNLLHARNCFGAMHIAAKIAAKNRPGPAPP